MWGGDEHGPRAEISALDIGRLVAGALVFPQHRPRLDMARGCNSPELGLEFRTALTPLRAGAADSSRYGTTTARPACLPACLQLTTLVLLLNPPAT